MTPAENVDTPAPPTNLSRATLLCASTLTVMSGAIISASLPTMEQHFKGTPDVAYLVRLVLTLPALFIVLGAPIAGAVVDRYGRKPLLGASLIAYGLAGSAGFLLATLPHLLFSRALLGLSVAGIMTSVTALLADYYSGPERAKVLGQQAAAMGLGGTVYTTLGGFLADQNWRFPFLIYLSAFLVFPFVLVALREPRRNRPDPARSAGAGPGVPPSEPVRPLVFVTIYAIVALLQIIFYLIPVQMPYYLKELFQAPGKVSGIAIGIGTLSYAVGSLLSPLFSGRMDRERLIALSFGLVALGYACIGLAPSYPVVLLGLVVSGQGFGYLIPYLAVWLTTVTPLSLRGRALGGQATAVFLGQFISPILALPIIHAWGYRAAYLAATALLTALALLVLVARFRRSDAAQPSPGTSGAVAGTPAPASRIDAG